MRLFRQQGTSSLFLRKVIGPDKLGVGICKGRCRSARKSERGFGLAANNLVFACWCRYMPPKGHILLADSTIFTTLFGGTDSLERF
jgi:hypothetical protein